MWKGRNFVEVLSQWHLAGCTFMKNKSHKNKIPLLLQILAITSFQDRWSRKKILQKLFIEILSSLINRKRGSLQCQNKKKQNLNKNNDTHWIIYFFRYQVLLGALFALLELPHAWCMLLHKFLSPSVSHWCSQPPELSQWSAQQWRNFSSPPGDSCKMYNRY